MLAISSKEREEKEENNERYMRREFSYTSFNRSFTLPQTVQINKIVANHKDGILQITIPKKEEAKVKPPKQIAIQ